MKILFIHQNFPGQFKFLAPALVQQGHEVVAMIMQKIDLEVWQGIKLVSYLPSRSSTPNIHPWVSDFETKTIRGEACYRAARKLRNAGFMPDVIIAHPGWGESLFLKDVWPESKLGIYCEFYYHAQGADVGFDPEFPNKDDSEICRLRLKNLNHLLHFEVADAGISPTHWQASTSSTVVVVSETAVAVSAAAVDISVTVLKISAAEVPSTFTPFLISSAIFFNIFSIDIANNKEINIILTPKIKIV